MQGPGCGLLGGGGGGRYGSRGEWEAEMAEAACQGTGLPGMPGNHGHSPSPRYMLHIHLMSIPELKGPVSYSFPDSTGFTVLGRDLQRTAETNCREMPYC